jgi:hypothetical protein
VHCFGGEAEVVGVFSVINGVFHQPGHHGTVRGFSGVVAQLLIMNQLPLIFENANK